MTLKPYQRNAQIKGKDQFAHVYRKSHHTKATFAKHP